MMANCNGCEPIENDSELGFMFGDNILGLGSEEGKIGAFGYFNMRLDFF